MKIHIEPHTLQRANERGASEEEIIDVIQTGEVIPAKSKRFAKAKTFGLNGFRLGKFYEEKRVEVYYIVEEQNIFTVTVYVFMENFDL